MSRISRARPFLETLENRICPVLYQNLDLNGNLFLGDGLLQGSTPSGALGIRYFAGDIEVYDGADFTTATLLSSQTVTGNIKIKLNNSPATVIIDLNGGDIRNLTIQAGNGGNTVNFADYDQDDDASGFIIGNLVIQTGTGVDLVKLGDQNGSVETWGNISVNLGAGNDGLSLDWGANVQGTVFLTNVNRGVALDPAPGTPHALTSATSIEFAVNDETTIQGSLIYSSTTEAQINDMTLGEEGTIEAHFSFATNVGKATQDTVVLQSDVNGNAVINLGNGLNNFTLDTNAEILGGLTYVGGSGNDVVVFNDAIVWGNMSLILASGDLAGNSATFNAGFTCNGVSLRIVGGNGVDTIIWDAAANANGAYFWMSLNSGNDTFTLGNEAAFARAYVDFGLGTDTFNAPVNPILFPYTWKNL